MRVTGWKEFVAFQVRFCILPRPEYIRRTWDATKGSFQAQRNISIRNESHGLKGVRGALSVIEPRPRMHKSHLGRRELFFSRTAKLNYPTSAELNHWRFKCVLHFEVRTWNATNSATRSSWRFQCVLHFADVAAWSMHLKRHEKCFSVSSAYFTQLHPRFRYIRERHELLAASAYFTFRTPRKVWSFWCGCSCEKWSTHLLRGVRGVSSA